MQPEDPRTQLSEIGWLFLRLGTISFGGPAAHIAMMQDEIVRRRQWLTDSEFLDLLSATNLIPGPNSTELAIHIGHRRAGWPGLLLAGICFILPATLIVAAIAWVYVAFGELPQVGGILYGVKPAIIAVVLRALYSLARSALKTNSIIVLAIAAALAAAFGVYELIVLFGAGGLCLLQTAWLKRDYKLRSVPSLGLVALLASAPAAFAKPFSLASLFLFFVKVGSVLFGSGYVLLAFLRADLVERWHWLTEAQLLDAIAVGQITPGPLFTTATFIGYVVGGWTGAIVATSGIFLPAFFFVAISGPLVPRLRRSALAGAFLDGVNAASLALMVVVTWNLGRAAIMDWLTLTIAIGSAVALFRYGVNSAWLVVAGASAGLLAS